MKKFISLILCAVMLVSVLSCAFTVSAVEDVALSVTGKVTDPVSGSGTFTVTVNLTKNNGINTLVLDLGYNADTLKLNSVKNGEVFTEANNGSMFDVKTELNPLRLYFEENSTGNITATGKVVTVKFDIIDDMGNFDITFNVDNDSTYCIGENERPQDVSVITGNDIRKNTQHINTGLPQTIAPTCTEAGRIEKRCTTCNKLLSVTPNGDALGHDWEEIDKKDATCTEDGYVACACTRCDAENTEVIKAAGHDTVTETTEPTTAKEGSEKVVCKVCGAVISEKVLPKLSDDSNKEDKKPSDTKGTEKKEDYPVSPKTGDEMIVVAFLAVVSLAGFAVVIKRRKEN